LKFHNLETCQKNKDTLVRWDVRDDSHEREKDLRSDASQRKASRRAAVQNIGWTIQIEVSGLQRRYQHKADNSRDVF
jgi:hypothetical protein